MMKKFLSLLMVAVMVTMSGCYGDDIDNLQKQVDDLDKKVEEMEAEMQTNLLAEIAKLQNELASLNGNYDDLLSDLNTLEEEIANNEAAVFYGNVVSEAEYAALIAQEGATIITGKVVASTDAHLTALASIKMIGQNLLVNGGTSISLAALESVAGSIEISDIMADTEEQAIAVELPMLASVGQSLYVENNTAIASVNAPKLVLVYAGLQISDESDKLTSVTFESLDNVGYLYMYNHSVATYNPGALATLDLSATNIAGDLDFVYMGYEGSLVLGTVEGDITLQNCKFLGFGVSNSEVNKLEISQCYEMQDMHFDNLTKVNGDLLIMQNNNTRPPSEVNRVLSLSTFDNLTEVGGRVVIDGNNFGDNMIGFNAVTAINTNGDYYSDQLVIIGNESSKTIEIFNGMVDSGNIQIKISGGTELFDSFGALERAGKVSLGIERASEYSWTEYKSIWLSDQCVVKGFDVLTDCWEIAIDASTITGFDAFNSFTEKWSDVTIHLPLEDALAQVPVLATDVYMCSLKPYFDNLEPDNTNVFVNPDTWENLSVAEGLSYVYDAAECGN